MLKECGEPLELADLLPPKFLFTCFVYISLLCLQSEYPGPGGGEGLVLGVGLHAVVDELEDGEGVRLAPDVGRVEALRLVDLDDEVAHVLHGLEGVEEFLRGEK